MIALLSQISFLNPWILASLISLPLLWYLLRVTPPSPQKIIFPAIRFLKDLLPERSVPSKTPWWLLLLRCLIVAFVILALSRPVLNPADRLSAGTDIRLVIDTGWAAAQTWDAQVRAAQEIIALADRDNRSVTLFTTTIETNKNSVRQEGPMTAGQADAILRGLKPDPWPSDYRNVVEALQTDNKSLQTHWFGHGLDEGGWVELSRELQSRGNLIYYRPDKNALPVLIKPFEDIKPETQPLQVSVTMPEGGSSSLPVSVNAFSENGSILHYESKEISDSDNALSMMISDDIRNEIARIQIVGRKGAGAILLTDEKFRKRTVGIVTNDGSDNTKPLIDSAYYLERALEPFASLLKGDIEGLIERNPSVLILPDTGSLPPATLSQLESWVKEGGLLLRFAGPEMAAANDSFLTPIPVLKGARALQGELTWENPLTIAPFPENSPFYGIPAPKEIKVRQQILATPQKEQENTIWASLEDGTPLITGAALEQGFLVLIHTTATPEWSDLALSKLYIDILRKIIELSAGKQVIGQGAKLLPPVSIMDGFGRMGEPKTAKPIPITELDTLIPSQDHPPGFYGQGDNLVAFNLGERIKSFKAVSTVPAGIEQKTYARTHEQDLMPFFLMAAFGLFMLDWLIMCFMAMGLRLGRSAYGLLIFCFISAPAQAQNTDTRYAGDIYLAYIGSGDPRVDQVTENGLNALADILKRRTSVEPLGSVQLNPETDTLSFFPLIYWPVSAQPPVLSEAALKNLQYYLDNGGTILFDTRDQSYSAQNFSMTQNGEALRQMIGRLSIPALMPAPDDHVLRRSFYLLDGFPGRYSGGPLWIEQQSAGGRDGVSAIIIGSHDWAGAWAAEMKGGTLHPHLSGGSRQQEMAYRFGVNLMMYALTGNYKADQVHLPHILERLDQ